jgi:hypothetical protein
MSLPERIELPAELPPLDLDVRPLPPGAWSLVVRRLRRRRRRAASWAAGTAVAAVGTPVLLLGAPAPQAPQVAHRAAEAYDDICAVRHDQPAPGVDRLTTPFRIGSFYFSAPERASPAVPAAEIRRRAEARGMPFREGTQLRYGLVRSTRGGKVHKTELRWVLTTCGEPRPRFVGGDPTTPPRRGRPDLLVDDVQLLTDSGHADTSFGSGAFAGVCDTRLDERAPDLDRVTNGFHVGEARVTPPDERTGLRGRQQVERALRDLGRAIFPGTQIRMAQVQPLHAAGSPRTRWVVTTCSLDGRSVRPALPGVVNELLVFDERGRLLAEHRSGPRSEAEVAIRTFPPVPDPLPTHRAAHPNMCGPWSHAYPDVRAGSRAAGYDDMQGCYRQADSVVVFLSRSSGPAVAALATCTAQTQCERQRADRYPYSAFRLVPAPRGSRAELLRLLSPTVAEVRLSGDGVAAVSMKFDARSGTWSECADATATRAPCRG